MSERFATLRDLDAAAKAQERERFFQAKLMVTAVPAGDLALNFRRGGPSSLSPDELKAVYQRETEAPEWTVAGAELRGLAEAIEERVPDPGRAYLFVAELSVGAWHLAYGPELMLGRGGEDLDALVAEVTDEVRSLPPDWRPPDPAALLDLL